MTVTKQGAWGLWWLCGITFGIYYIIWYARVNRELCAILGEEVPFDGQMFATLIPILNIIGLINTADRLNRAHERVGSPTRVGGGMTILSAIWFSSHTRYLQRRVNTLADVVHAPAGAPAAA